MKNHQDNGKFARGHTLNNGRNPWNKNKILGKNLRHSEVMKEKYANKEIIPFNKGKTKKDFPQMSHSGVKKGNKPWNTGLKAETDERVKNNCKNHSKVMKNIWANPEYKKKQLRLMRTQHKPTAPERKLIEIVKNNYLPFNYVGDGKIWLQGDENHFNPDFLSMNPKHIIEVFGTYWHSLPRVIEKDKKSLEAYQKYGYKTLVIWEHELLQRHNYPKPLSENQIVNRITEFIKN